MLSVYVVAIPIHRDGFFYTPQPLKGVFTIAFIYYSIKSRRLNAQRRLQNGFQPSA